MCVLYQGSGDEGKSVGSWDIEFENVGSEKQRYKKKKKKRLKNPQNNQKKKSKNQKKTTKSVTQEQKKNKKNKKEKRRRNIWSNNKWKITPKLMLDNIPQTQEPQRTQLRINTK